MLELKNITFYYRKESVLLNDVSVTFDGGKFYSVQGPSGVGKSTLLSVIAGLVKPQCGEICFDGVKSDFNEIIRKHSVSLIYQDFLLFPYMTAIQNVVTIMDICLGSVGGNNYEIKAKEILTSLGLEEADMYRPVRKISGGQQQRVAIARAIAVNSRYILADEPTGNLDEGNAELIIGILKDIVTKYNCCVIVVTHSEYIKSQADVSYKLTKGSLVKV